MDQYYSRACGYKLSFEPWNDKFDQRTYLKYCNGAETFYSYDPQRRRLQNLVVNAKAGTIMDNAYTYDAVSNVLSVKNGASVPQSGKAGGQMAHTYIRCPLSSCQRNWYLYWCRQQDRKLYSCDGLRQHASYHIEASDSHAEQCAVQRYIECRL